MTQDYVHEAEQMMATTGAACLRRDITAVAAWLAYRDETRDKTRDLSTRVKALAEARDAVQKCDWVQDTPRSIWNMLDEKVQTATKPTEPACPVCDGKRLAPNVVLHRNGCTEFDRLSQRPAQ